MNPQKHMEVVLLKMTNIFENISNRIEALKPGDKILATELAGAVGADYGMTCAQIYPLFLYFIRGYPGIEQKRGAKGGIYKLANTPSAPEVHDDVDVESEESEIVEEDKILPIINT